MTPTPELARLLAFLEENSIANIRDCLQQLRDLYSMALHISTWTVAVGIAMEAPEIWIDVRDVWIRWRKGYVADLGERRNPIHWHKIVAAFGWIIIVAGVVLEGRFEAEILCDDKSIEDIDLAHVAKLENDVVVAQRSATEAYESARDADLESEAASGRSTDAIRENSRLRKDLEAEKIAADKQLAVEQDKRVALAASLLPRKFKDQGGAAKALNSLSPVSVVLQFEDFDREARSLARQIAFVFSLLGWPCHRSHVDEYQIVEEGVVMKPGLKNSPVPMGFAQDQKDSEKTSRVAQKLSSLLNASGVDAKEGNMFGDLAYPTNTLIIKIGSKPNHVLDETLKELGAQPKGVLFNAIITDGIVETSIPEELVPSKP